MAVRKIAMVVNLRQNKNEAAEHFGKWYPEVDTKTPLDLTGFCAHMTEHGKLADYQMVVLVVQQVVECMKELVLQGQPVKLEGLGTFGPSLESKKGGASSVQAAMDAGLDSLIEGVHMNFTPENTKGEKLTSRALKDECVFDAGYVTRIAFAQQEEAVGTVHVALHLLGTVAEDHLEQLVLLPVLLQQRPEVLVEVLHALGLHVVEDGQTLGA